MRWEDERYVRFYTRDTPEWLALTWQARGLFGLLIRAVDRAGLLKVGKLGLKGAAVAVRAAWVEVEQPLKELLEDGCVVLRGDTLVIGNFLAAQEARQSDAARKRKEREVDLAKANAEKVTARDALRSQDVTEQGHEIGPDVTGGHVESQDVTPRHAVPSLAVPSLPEPSSAHDARPADAPRNGLDQEQLPDLWPRDAYLKAQRLLGVDDGDKSWGKFVGDCVREGFSVAARVAGVEQLAREGKKPGEAGPGLLLAIIRRIAKAQAKNGMNGSQVEPAAQTRWQKAGFKTEAEYHAKVREIAESRGGSDEAYAEAVHEVMKHAG